MKISKIDLNLNETMYRETIDKNMKKIYPTFLETLMNLIFRVLILPQELCQDKTLFIMMVDFEDQNKFIFKDLKRIQQRATKRKKIKILLDLEILL